MIDDFLERTIGGIKVFEKSVRCSGEVKKGFNCNCLLTRLIVSVEANIPTREKVKIVTETKCRRCHTIHRTIDLV